MEFDWVKFAQAVSPAIQMLLVALITAFVPVAGYYIRRLALQLEAKMQAGLSNAQWDLAKKVICNLVMAAEETFAEGDGAEKLQWVKERAKEQLGLYGISLDLDAIEDVTHGALWDEINQWQKERLGPVEAFDPTFQNINYSVSEPPA